MSTVGIRQRLHNYLDVADDKKIKAIYTLLEGEIEDSEVVYTKEFEAELDRRYANYKNGKTQAVTSEESKKRVQKLLKNARK